MLKYISKKAVFRVVMMLIACSLFFWYFGRYNMPNYVFTDRFIDKCDIAILGEPLTDEDDIQAVRDWFKTIERVRYIEKRPDCNSMAIPIVARHGGTELHVNFYLDYGAWHMTGYGYLCRNDRQYFAQYPQTEESEKVLEILQRSERCGNW